MDGAWPSCPARTGRAEIWVLDLGTKALKNLTGDVGRGKSGGFRPAWSPDGTSIAFSSGPFVAAACQAGFVRIDPVDGDLQ